MDGITNKDELKPIFFDFLSSFREYLSAYTRETVYELCVSEITINGQVQLFDGLTQGKAILKNQGFTSCFIGTKKMGGYRLDPNEKEEFFINTPLYATTISGTTILGLIKY